MSGLPVFVTGTPLKLTVTPDMLAGCALGSATASPSISPSVSCSSACSDSVPPLEIEDAMTSVLPGMIVCVCLPVAGSSGEYCSFNTQNANRMASSVFFPQSFSGFCCEYTCL